MERETQKGFILFPVIAVVALIAGVVLMTAPDSVKVKVAKAIHLEK